MGAPAPKNPPGHTLRPCWGGQKRLQAGKFSLLLPLQPNPFGHSPNPSSSGPGTPHSGHDTVPTEGLGVPRRGGKGLPSPAPSWSRCQVGRARPKGAGGCPGHNVTAAATQGHSDRDRNSRERPGPGPGGAAGTAQPRGSCNTEKPGSACQARLEKRPGGEGGREGGGRGARGSRKTRRDLCAEQPRQRLCRRG